MMKEPRQILQGPGYEIVRTESYTAYVSGRFVEGKRLHVMAAREEQIEQIAKALASSSRAVTIFFRNDKETIGKVPALFGAEYIDGKLTEVLVDLR